MMSRRVAIVGAGIGRAHMAGYLESGAGFEVRAVCDLDAARARDVAQLAPGCAVETALDALLARDDLDVIDICLPPRLHLDACIKALGSGRHVVCEKPLVASLAEVDKLEAAAMAAGRMLMPVYQYRFGDGLLRLLHARDKGLCGQPLVATVETHWDRDAAYYAVPWRGTWAGELGGAILGHAIHAHDLVTHVLGPVRAVTARLATRVNPIEVEDCAAVLLEMDSGALVTSSVTLGAAGNTSRLRFCYAQVTAESGIEPYRPADPPWQLTARAPLTQGALDAELGRAPQGRAAFAGLFAAFAAALDGEAPLPVTIAEARRSLELVTAIYISSREQRTVSLPLPADHPAAGGWTPTA